MGRAAHDLATRDLAPHGLAAHDPAAHDRAGPASTAPTRLILVDDHAMFAESLCRVLELEPDIEVAATAGSVAEACEASAGYDADIVVLDYALPDGTGAQAAEQIRRQCPGVKVVMLTGRDDGATMAASIEAGVDAFVAKRSATDELVHAIRALVQGRTALPHRLIAAAMPYLERRGPGLTRREREVLQLLADGRSTTAIADTLGVRATTVRNHVQRAIAKLGVHSRGEAVAAAVRDGLVTAPDRR